MANKRPGLPNKDFKDWNPLQKAYDDPTFNSYQEGPGANLEVHKLGRTKEKEGTFKLFVCNIPATLDERGIENLFRNFGQPFNVYKNQPLHNSSKTWGFVQFGSYREAESAIRELNNKLPFKLRVEFAKDGNEPGKEQKNILYNDDIEDAQPSYPIRSGFQFPRSHRGCGRGYTPSMASVPGMGLHRPGEYDDREEEDLSYFQPHRGSVYDQTNNMAMKGLRTSIGPRVVTMGRGYFNRNEDEMMSRSLDSSLHPDETQQVLCQLDTEFLQRENARKEHRGMEKTKGSMEGPCVNCGQVTHMYCRKCREWYCSDVCQLEDWSFHKTVCGKPPSQISLKVGNGTSRDSVGKASPENLQKNEQSSYRRKLTALEGQNNYSQGRPQRPLAQNDTTPDARQRQNDIQRFPKPKQDKPHPRKQHEGENRREFKGPNARDNRYFKDPRKLREGENKNRIDRRECKGPKARDVHFRDPMIVGDELNSHQKGSGRSECQKVDKAEQNTVTKYTAIEEPMPVGPLMCQVECLPADMFSMVKVNVLVNATEYWVYLMEKEESILRCTRELQLIDACNLKSCTPEVGSYCVALFSGLWFRARITSVNPLKVFYIDYGNEEICTSDDMRRVPESWENFKAQAIRIILAPGTSEVRHNLNSESLLKVKPVAKTKEGTIVVHVEGDKYEPLPEDNDTSSVDAADSSETDNSIASVQNVLVLTRNGMSGFLQVTDYNSEHDFVSSLVCTDHNSQYSLIHSPVFSNECERALDTAIKPQVGDFVLAKVGDGSWIRAFVLKVGKEKNIVASCETGLVETVDQVKPLPEKYRDIVTFAVQCRVSEWLQGGKKPNLEDIKKFSFTVDSASHNDAVIVLSNDDEVFCKVNVTEWIPPYHLYEQLKCVELNDGPCIITSFISSTIVYVRPSNKVVIEQANRILQQIAAHCYEVSPLETPPKVGQVLASMFTADRNYYRARVTDVKGERISVTYIDFGNSETVSINALKPLSEELKNSLCLAVKVFLKDVVDKPLNGAALERLGEVSGSDAELQIKLSGSASNEADLYLSDGTHLNEELNKLLEPSWKKKDKSAHDKILMFEDFMSDELPVGETIPLLLNVCIGYKTVVVVPKNSKVLQILKTHLQSQIDDYCNTATLKSYVPRNRELCLGKVDGKWHRCACIEAKQEISLVLMDHGSVVKVLHTDIRPMPKDLCETPAAAIHCDVKICGQEIVSPKMQSAVKDYLSAMREITAKVVQKIRCDEYVIEVPELNAKWRGSMDIAKEHL